MTKEKRGKIVNDPVYGFISFRFPLIFNIIEHPYFQRLRRIKQLGLTHLVYPGAQHTRFQHSIGAYHLMSTAISVLRDKGVEISEEEEEAACAAILLHDMGHGPFSHALEHSLMEGISHEQLSLLFMEKLNEEFEGQLSLAIEIFRGTYRKKFLTELISGQLDMDRLDYLRRDSFFTGVTEGAIGLDRIIQMLNVHKDHLVVDEKGIYSIEKFLVARRLMYWQVYHHKTVLSAEFLLIRLLERARELVSKGEKLFASDAMDFFLSGNINHDSVFSPGATISSELLLKNFSLLDDNDIISSAKMWENNEDKILSLLSRMVVNRQLFRARLRKKEFGKGKTEKLRNEAAELYGFESGLASYFVFSEKISNYAYDPEDHAIKILFKNGSLKDISKASDILNIEVLSKNVKKYCLCYPKDLDK